jgi:hypothetical protein
LNPGPLKQEAGVPTTEAQRVDVGVSKVDEEPVKMAALKGKGAVLHLEQTGTQSGTDFMNV